MFPNPVSTTSRTDMKQGSGQTTAQVGGALATTAMAAAVIF
jgi:hypothetical protein